MEDGQNYCAEPEASSSAEGRPSGGGVEYAGLAGGAGVSVFVASSVLSGGCCGVFITSPRDSVIGQTPGTRHCAAVTRVRDEWHTGQVKTRKSDIAV